jgi:TPR repeat protein
MYCLADCYKDGDGVIRSIQQARIWYQKAAEAGYRKALRELRELDEDDD